MNKNVCLPLALHSGVVLAEGAFGGGIDYRNFASPSGLIFVVKFNTYHWHRNWYVQYDEIAVTSCGGEQRPEELHDPLGAVTGPGLYSDGRIYAARVRYTPGELLVFLDDLEKPVLTATVKLEAFVSFDGDQAWVVFTAATGADGQNHDILSWTFGQPADAPAHAQPPASVPADRPSSAPNVTRSHIGPLVKSRKDLETSRAPSSIMNTPCKKSQSWREEEVEGFEKGNWFELMTPGMLETLSRKSTFIYIPAPSLSLLGLL